MHSRGIWIPGSHAGRARKWRAKFLNQWWCRIPTWRWICCTPSSRLREGTDYGEKEFSLEDKVSHVISQLKRGEAHIVFDPETETVSIAKRA